MLRDGYAAVTYRRVAEAAEVTAGLVQYYFPKSDTLFVAMVERRSNQHLERLLAALEERPDEPLRVVWEMSAEEQTAALTVEFMALANHRKTLRAEILEATKRTRTTQLRALKARWADYHFQDAGLTPEALLFLMHAVPKMVQLEDAIGWTSGHQAVLDLVERHLDQAEPRSTDASPVAGPT